AQDATRIDAPRRPHFSDSLTVVTPPAIPRRSKAKSRKTFGLVASLLVVGIVIGACLMTRHSGSSMPDAAANTEVQNSASASQQLAPAQRPSPAANSVAAEARHDSPGTSVSAEPAPVRAASETPASGTQTTTGPTSALDPLVQ